MNMSTNWDKDWWKLQYRQKGNGMSAPETFSTNPRSSGSNDSLFNLDTPTYNFNGYSTSRQFPSYQSIEPFNTAQQASSFNSAYEPIGSQTANNPMSSIGNTMFNASNYLKQPKSTLFGNTSSKTDSGTTLQPKNNNKKFKLFDFDKDSFKLKKPTITSDGVMNFASNMIGGGLSFGGDIMKNKADIDYSNLDKEVNQKKYKSGQALSGAGTGFNVGSKFGWSPTSKLILGGLGGIAGGIAGMFKGEDAAAAAEQRRQNMVADRNYGIMQNTQAERARQSSAASKQAHMRFGRKGFKFDNPGKVLIAEASFNKYKPVKKVTEIPVFEKGGKITDDNNIIPNGVSHEEENAFGTKGMPVVKCKKDSCEKVYEIESDELILTKRVTSNIEKLAKDKDFEALGELLVEEITENTHSYSANYDFINESI